MQLTRQPMVQALTTRWPGVVSARAAAAARATRTARRAAAGRAAAAGTRIARSSTAAAVSAAAPGVTGTAGTAGMGVARPVGARRTRRARIPVRTRRLCARTRPRVTLHLLVDDVVAQPPSQGRGGRERDEQRPRPVQADGVAEPASHRWLREPRRRARHAQPYLLQGRSPGLRAAPLPCGADGTHEVVRPETREAQADHHATHRLSGGGDDRHGDPEQGHERHL